MARIRSIKPEFWEDEDIAVLSPLARLLYIATWNMADDEGLLRWGAPFIKSRAFMYDDLPLDDVAALMAELVEGGFVVAYKGGKTQQPLGWIPSFPKHQKPNRPQPSKLPPPSIQNLDVRNVYAEREGWICSICGEPIPKGPGDFTANVYDNDGKPPASTKGLSMDHVTPRCQGGSDYPSNIRPAHRGCNSSKGGRERGSVNDSLFDADDVGVGFTPVGEGRGEVGIVSPGDNPVTQVRDYLTSRQGAKSGSAAS